MLAIVPVEAHDKIVRQPGELGQSRLSFDAAIELAKALGVSLDYLGGLGGSGHISPLEVLFKEKQGKLSKEKVIALKVVLEAF